MVLLFFIWRFFYHVLPKRSSQGNLLQSVKKDFVSLCVYIKQLILSNPKIIKTLLTIMATLLVLPFIPYKVEITYAVYDALATVMYLLLVILFAPKGAGVNQSHHAPLPALAHPCASNEEQKRFPVEIFGFTYAVILMFYSAGALVFDICYTNDFFKEDMWLYGYSITIISYVVCIATLRGFMERKLSNEEIVLLGMIFMTTLEFITYYGIGFFSGMEYYDMDDFIHGEFFENITVVVNHGIYVASQSQILERNSMEVWGNIILNGTDVLTITAVLGYVMQKFMEK